MTTSTGQYKDFSREFELLKRTYASKVEDMVPESDQISKRVPFSTADKLGQDFYQPVTLTRETGFTFWNDGSVKTLNQPQGSLELSALVRGAEFVNRTAMSYKWMNTARQALGKGDQAGKEAFVNATKDAFLKLTKGSSFARECNLLYGGGPTPGATYTGLGTVLVTTGSAGTSLVVTMSAAQWATAIWTGSEGAEFDIHSTAGTKRNSAGTTSDTIYKLVSCDPLTYKATFTSHATNVSNVVATDVITFAGSRTVDMLGFVGAAQTSGTLWNISTTTYALWAPIQVAVAGALTYEKVQQGMGRLAGIGFDGVIDLFVNPDTFQDVCNDQTALVTHGTGKMTGKVTIGFDDVSFKSQAGTVNLISHPYMKRGIALGLPKGECKRIGSTDLTHTMPGFGKMFRELENAAGVEARQYYDQAPFCSNAGHIVLFSGITNTTDV